MNEIKNGKFEYDKFESEESKKYKDKLNILNGFPTPFKYPKQTKNYLGDVKWVLYQTIIDLGSEDNFTIRCGSYAYSKIRNIFKCSNEDIFPPNVETLYLNGEEIVLVYCKNLDKKQIIISNKPSTEYYDYEKLGNEYFIDVSPDDIVLYFA